MIVSVLKSKIHRATVTGVDAGYEGSIVIDSALMEEVGLLPFEKILVANLNTGVRFETYALADEAGSRSVKLNGATARLGQIGDRIIIFAFAQLPEPEARAFSPRIIQLDEKNQVARRSFAR